MLGRDLGTRPGYAYGWFACREGDRMKRPTIADIAQRAGVTKAAVSFALNGQPGVSAATRERILAIAEEIGFQPNSAARALTAGRAGAFGLVIDRPARTLGIEPFFMQLVSGIQAELAGHQVTLLFTMTEDADAEIELYRQWWAQRRVDGVFVVDLQVDDRRIAVVEELRMPAVVIGTPRGGGRAARRLAGRPRRRGDRGRLPGRAGAPADRPGRRPRHGTGTPGSATTRSPRRPRRPGSRRSRSRRTTRPSTAPRRPGLLGSAEPPTAIVYDNDVMAAAGLGVAQRMAAACRPTCRSCPGTTPRSAS